MNTQPDTPKAAPEEDHDMGSGESPPGKWVHPRKSPTTLPDHGHVRPKSLVLGTWNRFLSRKTKKRKENATNLPHPSDGDRVLSKLKEGGMLRENAAIAQGELLNSAAGAQIYDTSGGIDDNDDNNDDNDDDYIINCMCGQEEDDGNTVYCGGCDTWQHTACYYIDDHGTVLSNRDLEDLEHWCTNCRPRVLNVRGALERHKNDHIESNDAKVSRASKAISDSENYDNASGSDTGSDSGSSVQSSFKAESIFSIASSRSSISTNSTPEQLSAVEELILLLIDNEVLHPLYKASIEDRAIGGERFERNFRRLLQLYGSALRDEAREPREIAAAQLVRSRAQYVTECIRAEFDPDYARPVKVVELQRSSTSERERHERVEQYLGHLKSVVDEDNYEIDLPNLTFVKDFLVSGTPFHILCLSFTRFMRLSDDSIPSVRRAKEKERSGQLSPDLQSPKARQERQNVKTVDERNQDQHKDMSVKSRLSKEAEDLATLFYIGSCPECHHYHGHVPFHVLVGDHKDTKFQCANCQHPVFSTGGQQALSLCTTSLSSILAPIGSIQAAECDHRSDRLEIGSEVLTNSFGPPDTNDKQSPATSQILCLIKEFMCTRLEAYYVCSTDIYSRVYSTLARNWEPPLKAGKVRIRWTCQCGSALWDDFKELQPGAAEELRWNLQSFASKRKSSGRSGLVKRCSIWSCMKAWKLPLTQVVATLLAAPGGGPDRLDAGYLGPANFTNVSTTASGTHLDRSASSAAPSDGVSEDGNNTGPSPSNNPACHKKYLLLCFRRSSDTLRLHQLEIGNVKNDVQLFRLLQRHYLEQRGRLARWCSPRKLVSVSFRKFERHPRDRVVMLTRNDCLPNILNPEACHVNHARCDTKYDLQPVPPRLEPYVGPNGLEHLINHPHEAEDEGNNLPIQNVWLARFPKKEKSKLQVCPPYQFGLGWGIQFEEGWHLSFVIRVAVAALIGCATIFLVCWWTIRGDLQGAAGVAALMIAFATMIHSLFAAAAILE